jgi:acyl phosphate:glycerol-3-phosphate acyltransferase
LAFVVAILVWAKHHENIRRLLSGTESKIGKKS